MILSLTATGYCGLMMNKLPYFISIFVVVILDQLSKWYVLEEMLLKKAYDYKQPRDFFTWMTEVKTAYLPSGVHTPIMEDFMHFTLVWNKGISFGLFRYSGEGINPIVVITGAITAALTVWLWKAEDLNIRTGLLLVIGGALGNIIDRVRFGSVIDFVDVFFGDWHYPAFNFADSCIVVGVLLLLLNTLMSEKKAEPFSLKKKK